VINDLPSDVAQLEALTRLRFGALSDAERRFLKPAPDCEELPCGPSPGEEGLDHDPANAKAWGRERNLRAELIRWVCTDPAASKLIGPGGLQAYAARITGQLDLSYVSIQFPLRIIRCYIAEHCDFQYIKIPDLGLGGSLAMAGINLESAEVRHHVLLGNDFLSQGKVDLRTARIGGTLDCVGGNFKNPNEEALAADSAVIGQSILLRDCTVDGDINLRRCHVGDNLECDGSSFKNPDGEALTADAAEIGGSVFLRAGFSAEGCVNLLAAQMGGLECDNATFNNPDLSNAGGVALDLDSAQIRGSALLRSGFSANGTVNFRGCHIAGYLQIAGWDMSTGTAELILSDASAASLWDDEASWPSKGKLNLDGFVYGRIAEGPVGASDRLRWLDLQPLPFKPQPYRQLAKVLRDMGDDEGARQVLFALEKRSRAEDRRKLLHAPARWLNLAEDKVYDATVGYGIYPGRAVWYLGGLTALGWLVHWRAQRMKAMAPTEKEAYEEFHNSGQPPKRYPPFNPLIYSLENCIPLVKFGQDDHWQPDPNPEPRVKPAPGKNWKEKLGNLAIGVGQAVTSPPTLRCFRWIMIGLGWLLATFFLAAVSGIIKTN